MNGFVVRGYILPYIKDKEVKYTERVQGKELIGTLKSIVDEVSKYVGRRKIENAKQLNRFLDLILIRIKESLYLDPIIDEERVLIASPLFHLFNYYIKKYWYGEDLKPLYDKDGLSKFIENIREEVEGSLPKSSPHLMKLFEALKMPADTRPVANTSSLLLHLIVTSAIASSIYINRSKDCKDEDLAKVRLLSLFHDVGKFINWKEHEKESAKILRGWLLNEELIRRGSEAWNTVENVAEILEKGPQGDRFYDILLNADRIASGFDRLIKFLPYGLSEQTKNDLLNKINQYFGRNLGSLEDALNLHEIRDDWRFWNEYLPIEYIEKITGEFCKNAFKSSYDNVVIKELLSEEAHVLTREVEMVRIDVRGVQTYIKNNELRAIMGSSRIIDFVTYASLANVFFELKPPLPYECAVMFGGGNLTAIVPSGFGEKIKEKINKGLNIPGIEVAIGSSPLYNNYLISNSEMERNLGLNKIYGDLENIKDEATEFIRIDPMFKRCDSCGRKAASTYISATNAYMCNECDYKYRVGGEEYFAYRIFVYPSIHSDEKVKLLGSRESPTDIPVFIAGHGVEEASHRREVENFYNLALVKFDANLVGQFMSSSLSITDAFERSIRVDYSTKCAVNEFYKLLKEVYKDDGTVPLRFLLGYMYCGGDDGAFILPANLAIPFALYVVNRYYTKTGGKSTLSLSIVGAKPKHPIIPLYEAADRLLKHTKGTARGLQYELMVSESLDKLNGFRGAISFINIDTGRVSEEYVLKILDELYADRVSIQKKNAYTLSSITEDSSIMKLIRLILPNSNLELDNLDNVVRALLEKFADKGSEEAYLKHLDGVREIVHNTLSISLAGTSDVNLKISYIATKSDEFKLVKERKVIDTRTVLNSILHADDEGPILSLIDLDFLAKLLGGGRSLR
ncbi:MAG: hypothetical protein QXX41_12610 [Nitrososphaerota archaeon]